MATCKLPVPVAPEKVRPAREEMPVTFKVEPSMVAPELFTKVADTPAKVLVPEIDVVAAEMPEVTAS